MTNKKLLTSRKFLILLLVSVSIISLIFLGFAIHLANRKSSTHKTKTDGSRHVKPRLSLTESIYSNQRMPFYYWRSDILIYLAGRNYFIIRYPNGSRININDSKIPIYSNDMSRILYTSNSRHRYRHSNIAVYYVNRVNAQTLEPQGSRVYIGPKMTKISANYYLQHFSWSPSGHRCAFVHKNNLYWSEDPMSDTNAVSITKNMNNGSNIFFGVPDWIYEEEILMNSFTYWWSPDSNQLSFLGIDESQVHTFRMYMYQSVRQTIYGSFMNFKYPKAGQGDLNNNPIVTVYIYSIAQNKVVNLEPPDQLVSIHGTNYYVEFIRWYDASVLLIGWVSRRQNEGYICSYTFTQRKCSQVYNHNYGNGWINLLKQNDHEPIPYPATKSFFTILPNPNTREQFRNIALLKVNSSSQPTWLNQDPFDVKDILHYDEKLGLLYYTMAAPEATQSNLYIFDLKANQSNCLSCDDTNCTSNSFSLSKSGKFMVRLCSGPGVPKSTLYSIDKENTTKIFDLITNEKSVAYYKNKSMPLEKIRSLKIYSGTENETLIYSRVIYPPEFDEKKRYPVVYYVYGGPFYQVVTTRFQVSWQTFLASSLNTIVIQADARGTPNRGRRFEMAIYKEVGNLEIADHYAIIKEIASWSFVNEDKIGIYGLSYGGFAVGHLLGLPENKILRCGISISPVTDFRLYDTAYTERFNGLYKENVREYEKTNIGYLAKNFKDKELLLIHGTGDDNVHFINSAQFIKALQMEDIDFNLMIYPDEDHSIGRYRIHMYKHMTRFIYDCFDKVSHKYTDLRDQDL